MVRSGTFTAARLRRVAPIFLAVLLVGCAPAIQPPDEQSLRTGKVRIRGGVTKFCDEGRAVYLYAGYDMEVVENAPECAK